MKLTETFGDIWRPHTIPLADSPLRSNQYISRVAGVRHNGSLILRVVKTRSMFWSPRVSTKCCWGAWSLLNGPFTTFLQYIATLAVCMELNTKHSTFHQDNNYYTIPNCGTAPQKPAVNSTKSAIYILLQKFVLSSHNNNVVVFYTCPTPSPSVKLERKFDIFGLGTWRAFHVVWFGALSFDNRQGG